MFREAEEIVKDTEKGASELALDSIYSMLDLDERGELKDYALELLDGRPSMTPIVNLVNRVLLALEDELDVRKNIEEFRSSLKSSKKMTVETGSNHLKEMFGSDITLLTISYSSTVVKMMKGFSQCLVLESRPAMEGKKTAKRLAGDRDVCYFTDAAVADALDRADAVVMGADTVTDEGFLNKIGSRPLAFCAERLDTPWFVLSDEKKLLPPEVPHSFSEKHPPGEVWDVGDDKIEVHNDYFEFCSWGEGKLICGEDVIGEKGIKKKIAEKEVSSLLIEHHPSVR